MGCVSWLGGEISRYIGASRGTEYRYLDSRQVTTYSRDVVLTLPPQPHPTGSEAESLQRTKPARRRDTFAAAMEPPFFWKGKKKAFAGIVTVHSSKSIVRLSLSFQSYPALYSLWILF